jgi:hypothetical protein
MATPPLLGGTRADRRPHDTGTDVPDPSDTSYTGDDVAGNAGTIDTDDAPLDTGTSGARSGKGKRAAADRDTVHDARDISPDHIVQGDNSNEIKRRKPERPNARR